MVNKWLTIILTSIRMSLFPWKAANNARLSRRMAVPVAKIYAGLTAGGPRRVPGAARDGNGDWPSGGVSNAPFKEKRREVRKGGLRRRLIPSEWRADR